MKSKTSFFNKGIFNNLLKRFWPAWALYSIVWLLAMPVEFLSGVRYADNVAASFVNRINGMSGEVSVVMAFFCAVIVATGIFSFMYRQRETSMVASLPVKREGIFCSAYLAGLLPLVAINAIIAVLTLLTAVGHINGECVTAILIWFGTYTLEFIAFYGIACFIAVFTGSIIALPVFYAIFNFLAVGSEFLIRSLINSFVYGMSNDYKCVTEFLSPAIYMVEETGTSIKNAVAYYGDTTGTVCPSMTFNGWTTVIIYAVVGIILAICGMLIFRRRKMECVGDVVAIPALRPVFKYGVSVCAAICFGLLLYLIFWDNHNGSVLGVGGFAALVFFMAVGGAVGYFGADMLNKKSAHVFKGNWSGYIAVVIACAALCAVCRFDVFGLGTYVPNETDIMSVKIAGSYSDIKLTEADDIKAAAELHRGIVSDINEIAKENDEMFTAYNEEYYYNVNFIYTLNNGKTVKRGYSIKESNDNAKRYVELMESEAFRDARCVQYGKYTAEEVNSASLNYCIKGNDWYGCELTGEQAVDLYKNAVADDIMEGNADFTIFYSYNDNYPTLWIRYDEFAPNGGYEYSDFSIAITPECVHTIQWFKDNLGVDLSTEIQEPIVNAAMGESTEYAIQ